MLRLGRRREKIKVQSASYTDIGGREDNEDFVQIVTADDTTAICCVVADGLGGHGGGRIASQAAAGLICADWHPGDGSERLTELLKSAHRLCLLARAAVLNENHSRGFEYLRHKAAWAHVGDSRLYHFDNGRLAFQTLDHSLPQIAVQLGEITPEQIRFHPDRNRVLRALGQSGELMSRPARPCLQRGGMRFCCAATGFGSMCMRTRWRGTSDRIRPCRMAGTYAPPYSEPGRQRK